MQASSSFRCCLLSGMTEASPSCADSATLAATPLLYGKAHQALTRFLFILSFPLMSAPLLQDIKAASRAHLSFEAAHEGVQPLPGGKDLPCAAGFVVLRCCRAIIMP